MPKITPYMFIFCPYHAFSSKAQGLIQVQFTKIVYLTPKAKYTIHHFANTTSIIYIISHAYNMLIHEEKYLPRLGICWSCPRSPKGLFALGFGKERNVLRKYPKVMRAFDNKIWCWGLYIDPRSFLVPCGIKGYVQLVNYCKNGSFPLWAKSFNPIWA